MSISYIAKHYFGFIQQKSVSGMKNLLALLESDAGAKPIFAEELKKHLEQNPITFFPDETEAAQLYKRIGAFLTQATQQ